VAQNGLVGRKTYTQPAKGITNLREGKRAVNLEE